MSEDERRMEDGVVTKFERLMLVLTCVGAISSAVAQAWRDWRPRPAPQPPAALIDLGPAATGWTRSADLCYSGPDGRVHCAAPTKARSGAAR